MFSHNEENAMETIVKSSQISVPNKKSIHQERELWYDARSNKSLSADSLKDTISDLPYSGAVIDAGDLEDFGKLHPLKLIVAIEKESDLSAVADQRHLNIIILADNFELAQLAQNRGLTTCYKAFVDSSESLHEAINRGKRFAYLCIRFKDPTNIPLELVIASLQATGTILINEIVSRTDVDAAVVVLGVMEYGADGVMFSPEDPEVLSRLKVLWHQGQNESLSLEDLTVVESRPVGMGYRACVDLATLFSEDEGMLIGSTSQGGILCCPEVFHLPYMELRPFRINAGAIHSYIYGIHDTTNYLSELKAGDDALVVNLSGQSSRAVVGRIKTELRPLRLIRGRFASEAEVNILLQDDWHVRVFGADGKPLNSTEIKTGDQIAGYQADPGRHVGINIKENILEQ